MSTARIPRLAVFTALVAALLLAASSCSPRTPSPNPNGDRTIVDAPIESIDILTRETFPPGYTAHIVSGLPGGCARFNLAEVLERTGNTITIRVTNTMPADPNTICTAIYGYKETNLDLGTNFTARQTYTVHVNDKTTPFVAQ